MLNRQSRVIFSVLLVVSILLHALAWWWVDVKELFKPEPSDKSTTVQVTLQPPPEPQEPPVKEKPAPKPQKKKEEVAEPVKQERHLPRHNADTFSSSNNTDSDVNKYKADELVDKDNADKVGEKEKDKKKEAEKASKPENKKPVVVNNQPKNKKQEIKEPKPDKSESASETKSKQVYSESKSDKLKMKNLYLKRMMTQITDNLITPRKPVRKGRGTIALVLNGEGFLVKAIITKSSGDFVLDLSVMEAIKRVHRYEVPDSVAVAEQYYSQLTIRYDQTIFDQ